MAIGRWPERRMTAARDRNDLRPTFASLLVRGGASLEMIGKLLGHSQMQTTQGYAHLMDSLQRAGVDAVASAFRPCPVLVHDADAEPLARKTA
jgi:integrase